MIRGEKLVIISILWFETLIKNIVLIKTVFVFRKIQWLAIEH